MSAPRETELRFAENGDAILTLKTPLPPEILMLSEQDQEDFKRMLHARLAAALSDEFFRAARDRAIVDLIGGTVGGA